MKSWSFLIVEDSEIDILEISNHLKVVPLYELTVCRSIEEAIVTLRSVSFDIVFLDLKFMEGSFTGLDLLTFFPYKIPIIIVSSYPEYAIKSFDYDTIVDFLEKPITSERFKRAVNRALKVNFSETGIQTQDSLYLRTGRKISKFEINDILYFQSYGIYSKVYLPNGVHLVNEPFITLMTETLSSKHFRRIQKSYIININKITGFDQNFFYIDSHKIPIGKTYRTEIEPLLKLLKN